VARGGRAVPVRPHVGGRRRHAAGPLREDRPGQHQQALWLCRAAARHGGSPTERSRLCRAAGARSGLGAKAALAELRRQERILGEAIQLHATDAPGQRIRQALPDYPGPDLQLPWAYHITPDGRIARRRAHGWEDVLLCPLIPVAAAPTGPAGRWRTTCWLRPEPGRWRRQKVPREQLLVARRLGRLLPELFGRKVTTAAGTGAAVTYLADVELLAREQVSVTEPAITS
jgi:hypothetical protein